MYRTSLYDPKRETPAAPSRLHAGATLAFRTHALSGQAGSAVGWCSRPTSAYDAAPERLAPPPPPRGRPSPTSRATASSGVTPPTKRLPASRPTNMARSGLEPRDHPPPSPRRLETNCAHNRRATHSHRRRHRRRRPSLPPPLEMPAPRRPPRPRRGHHACGRDRVPDDAEQCPECQWPLDKTYTMGPSTAFTASA